MTNQIFNQLIYGSEKKTLQDTRIRKTPEKKYKQNIKTQSCESIN